MDSPLHSVTIDHCRIDLLGTAHVSRRSAEQVVELLNSGDYHGVAIELCPSRFNHLQDPQALARLDLWQLVKSGRVGQVAASLALGAYQQRLADRFGIEPGAEMRAAITTAKQQDMPVHLIDREIAITLRRTAANVPWWRRGQLMLGLISSVVVDDELQEDEIEKLKQSDTLERTFAQFAKQDKGLYHALIDERDQYMAAHLRQQAQQYPEHNLLAVVGAGHVNGIKRYLTAQQSPEQVISTLEQTPPRSWLARYWPWLIVAIIFGGFGWGFSRSGELGWQLVMDWVLINGSLSALGALVALAHPLTILTAFLAAPLTSLNPAIGAGMVTAAVEIWLRRPQVEDFATLRQQTTHWQGWWRNRVCRVLLVFLFSSLGSAIGTYVAGARIFERLVS